MTLYVHNLQLNTAHQLLKLFQIRYPSVYKAEIFKKGGDSGESEDRSGSSEGSDSEDNEGEELIGGGPRNPFRGRVRRSYRRLCELIEN